MIARKMKRNDKADKRAKDLVQNLPQQAVRSLQRGGGKTKSTRKMINCGKHPHIRAAADCKAELIDAVSMCFCFASFASKATFLTYSRAS